MKPLVASMGLLAMLTACSTVPPAPVVRVEARLEEIDPPLPEPVQPAGEIWFSCRRGEEPMACVSVEDAERVIRNRIDLAEYIFKLRNIIEYYRTRASSRPEFNQ
jgi:hypothetical protein